MLNGIVIEIKPTVGDDYPAVLRQIGATREAMERHRTWWGSRYYLFLQDYVGTGATREQFLATFKSADIKVIFRADVERNMGGAREWLASYPS